jgi:hypothetical protein
VLPDPARIGGPGHRQHGIAVPHGHFHHGAGYAQFQSERGLVLPGAASTAVVSAPYRPPVPAALPGPV